ncbi:hypothetical protein HWC26_gp071 [Aeromonas phage 2L372X]|uniref:Uncharacterized protein n=2 Tax=Plateaulakevirus TaxID=2843436 RepID=A0A5B9NBU7_9CAUD|nr:hypothetical protein HWC26_gp071 [Aeromonas phage 2L372X]YP_009846874.1 hypothetical protein HWC28_gp075 [Aeromonas phage 4L372XY]QEG08323.1 hypothetical protein [Aeromonas phage 2L372X]QEG08790.1 hypothetical protein [Aeromonas phage 4L372XY]
MAINISNEDWVDMIWGAYNKARDLAIQNGIEDKEIRGALHFGPAHILWEDQNFKLQDIKWCLDNFDNFTGKHSKECLEYVKYSLLELIIIHEMFDVVD